MTRSAAATVLRFIASTSVVALAAGCASVPKIPTYPLMDVPASLALMADRAAKSHGATGKGAVTLSSPTHGGVRLDAVFVLRPPDEARVRAWKFGQAVFDLTVNRDGTWLFVPREPGGTGDITVASRDAGAAIKQWLTYIDAPPSIDAAEVDVKARTITTTRKDEGGTLVTTIDRPTLTTRSYRLVDANGTTRFELQLDRYQQFGEALWPTRIEAKSATGIITIETRELQPNVVAPTAFKPPARAVRLP